MAKSRLPRLHSSPDHDKTALAPSMASSSLKAANSVLKRKLASTTTGLESEDQPRKLPAIGAERPIQPLRDQTRNTNGVPSYRLAAKPPALTVPKPPVLSTSRSKRANSAPPKPIGQIGSRASTRNVVDTKPGRRNAPGTLVPKTVDDKRFRELENQLASIEEARAESNAKLAAEMEAERKKAAELYTSLQADQAVLSRALAAAKAQELTQRRDLVDASDEIENLRKKHQREVMDLEMDLKRRDREIRELNEDLRVQRGDLERERETVSTLKSTISQLSNSQLSVTTQKNALQSQIHALQAMLDESTSSASQLRLTLEAEQRKVEKLEQEARDAEGVRRKLHNMVQELKGNIRVFCRVRPILPSDSATPALGSSSGRTNETGKLSTLLAEESGVVGDEIQAEISFPDRQDHREIVVSSSSESAMGQERKEVHNFSFDRVFEPETTQSDVFEEVSQLAQSCTDGYNVCIFAYGQTGSGKSFTMEGGLTDATSGMIPRAVQQVFSVAEDLKHKGWEYTMEGQFLEIYNETINDLLGNGEFDKKKHEIKHDAKTGSTRVTDVNVVPLASPTRVRSLLSLAQSRRSVAATLMNERSSRSHSVFTLRITGTNKCSGEQCEGSLNLVDLAGSERLNTSGAGMDRDRLKETQNINRSLSALGDVIAALGEKGEKGEKHIPYRNSKLTYLLQNSLSGNSKTLMILNLSPLAAHLNESLTSLRFATKVNNTTIGTAKKQSRT